MARPLRIEFAGALYHVTSRGDGREAIYLDDEDREVWLGVLAEVCRRYNWVCHAYCLMSNHYHILIETPESNLSLGMRQLNGVYTQQFNRRHNRVGHVFQGRYKGILVDKQRTGSGLNGTYFSVWGSIIRPPPAKTASETRRQHIPVGSNAASLLHTVSEAFFASRALATR